MEKGADKEKGPYREKLLPTAKQRYLDKIRAINNIDPYDLPAQNWIKDDPEVLPPLTYLDIVNYLVYGVSAYTSAEFKNFRSLEAHQQFIEGWVQHLQIHKPADCDNTVILAKVMHSQRLSEAPPTAWVIISSTGVVSSAHCTCMAGIAETCTHVGALLFKVDATVRFREMKTVTDKPAYWILPGNVNKVQAEVGHKIDYTSADAKRKSLNSLLDGETDKRPGLRTCAKIRQTTTPSPTASELEQLYAELHKTGDRPAILSVLPHYCEEFRDPVQPVTIPKSLLSLRDPNLDGSDFSTLEQHCQKLKTHADVSEEQAQNIEKRTQTQHNSSLWFATRAGRITASNMHAVCATDISSPALSTVKSVCYPKDHTFTTADVTWGVTHEDDARKAYILKTNGEHNNQEVATCGFFINPDFPELGASPDGTVSCICCGKGCIEIKCPSKYKANSIQEACLAKDSNFCLELVDGEVQLKKGHKYYTQVQTQIFVTDSNYCDFVVWTLKDCVVLRIEPNPEFWRPRLQKAQQFFMAVALPELTAQHFTQKGRSTTSSVHKKRERGEGEREEGERGEMETEGRGRKERVTLWCLCHGPEDKGDMVACDNENCRVQWFHLQCVGLADAPAEDEAWFCPNCSK